MARVWNTFKAPDGRKYYYNSRTKQSTWERPESFDDEVHREKGKRAKLASEIEPFYVIPLLNEWHLVIGDTGGKFYYNSTTKESTWKLDDHESSQLLSSMDKEKLVLLIAIARGYKTGRGEEIYNEVIHEVEVLKETQSLDRANHSEENPKNSETEESEEEMAGGLVTAYSSSDEDDEDEGDNEVENEEEPSYNFDVSIFNNLEETQEPRKSGEMNRFARNILFSLFERHGCDPYSAWSIQARKIQDDPEFLKVPGESFKEEIFEEWCQENVQNKQMEATFKDHEMNLEAEVSENDEVELEPLKFHYLAHIVSKSEITPTTIFLDIKNQNKSEFKKYKIKNFVESRRLQETFVSKLLFYYKKMTKDDRARVFRETLENHQDLIRENLYENQEKVQKFLNEEPPDPNDAYAIETRLLEMENWMGISRNVPDVADDPKYYVLGIRDKMTESMQYIKRVL